MKLSYEALQKHFTYDENLKLLRWKLPTSNRSKPGDPAGRVTSDGYRRVGFLGKTHSHATLVWMYHGRPLPKGKILDHKDLDRTNDCLENLRVATTVQNAGNVPRHRDNRTGYKGVYLHCKDLYTARVQFEGRVHRLGYYKKPRDAAKAYDKKALSLFGRYARVNFPGETSHG